MGQILLIKGADFSQNAVSLDSVYDLVRVGDTPTPHYPLTQFGWRYNSKAVTKKTTVYAVSITLPNLAEVSSPTPSKERSSKCIVGVYDGSGTEAGFTQIQEIDISNIINAWIDGDIADGSTHIIQIPVPLVLIPGKYYGICCGLTTGGNRTFCYARVSDGSNGWMADLSHGDYSEEGYGMANDWYGVEED